MHTQKTIVLDADSKKRLCDYFLLLIKIDRRLKKEQQENLLNNSEFKPDNQCQLDIFSMSK